jgi:hypothetical protein
MSIVLNYGIYGYIVGLALILACILQSSSTWKNCKFRIFGVTDKIECLTKEKIK